MGGKRWGRRRQQERDESRSRKQRQPAHGRARLSSQDERALRERIQEFAYQKGFRDDFERAIRVYFGEEALQDDILTVDEMELPGFQEWYIHDYVTDEGERIIDLFAREVGPRLPQAQRQMLDDWLRTNRMRLFEVQAVEPGVGETVQDLLSGEVLEVNDISASHSLTKWQIFLARPLLTEGRLHFTGAGVPLPPMEKREILDFAEGLWENYQKQRPRASLDDFYQDHGLDLFRRAEEIAATPPTVYTPEGHPVMSSTARYVVTDPHTVEQRLDDAEEFVCVGPAGEDETALAYTWQLRGRSHVPESSIEGKGLMLRTEWTAGPGKPSYRSLGDVRLWPDRLELGCLSRERLEAGKALLEDILGRLIRHRADEFRDLDTMMAAAERAPRRPREEIPPDVREALTHQMVTEQRAEWLDSPVPALDGKSPRQAARDPGMREQLEELLKVVEYLEERKRQDGEPYLDVADLRRELGLPPR